MRRQTFEAADLTFRTPDATRAHLRREPALSGDQLARALIRAPGVRKRLHRNHGVREQVQLSISQRKRLAEPLQLVVAACGSRAAAVEHLACSPDAVRDILANKATTRISKIQFLHIAARLKVDVSKWDVCDELSA